MEWIEETTTMMVGDTEKVRWVDHVLLWNNFVILKMTTNNGKVYMFGEAPRKYKDRDFSFMRTFMGREDIDQVKQEIIDLLKTKQ